MNWAAAARGIFNADAIVQITFRAEIAELSQHTTVLQAFLDRVETADKQRGFALLKHRAVFGMDVDHAGVTETELCRKRAGDE